MEQGSEPNDSTKIVSALNAIIPSANQPLTLPPISNVNARTTLTLAPVSPFGQICPINLRTIFQSVSLCSFAVLLPDADNFRGSSPLSWLFCLASAS